MSGASLNPGADRTSIWTRPQRGSRGPAPTHSRAEIVAAAVALADASGLAAVSMRAVAAALGTGAGTLYRYLSSRDDLLDLMADDVVAGLRPYPPAGADWLASMLALAREQLALYRRHPWLVDLLNRPSGIGPEGLAWFDHLLGVLEPVQCATTRKFEAIGMMTGVVSLFARSEATAGTATFAAVDPAAHPHLVRAFAEPAAPPGDDLFDRTLRVLLGGLLG